eukprot:TRINITY_DN2125_c0_g1_i1.p1 TRINITY_DN2125_c0_g1~~TRINITY_DN2125_c0_g1_i1.p1  ORF type:complete len:151 (-),score=24.59 TRINITY_DN2125_c0_g1_i1:225-677(-)
MFSMGGGLMFSILKTMPHPRKWRNKKNWLKTMGAVMTPVILGAVVTATSTLIVFATGSLALHYGNHSLKRLANYMFPPIPKAPKTLLLDEWEVVHPDEELEGPVNLSGNLVFEEPESQDEFRFRGNPNGVTSTGLYPKLDAEIDNEWQMM